MFAAVQFSRTGAPDVLDIVTLPDLAPAAEGHVLVRVSHSGLSRYDSKVRTGEIPMTLPRGLGNEFAGVITDVGAGVTAVRVGEPVLGWVFGRAHAEFVDVPAHQVSVKPEPLDWAAAGSLAVAANAAWRSLELLDPADGETLLVTGATGAVGMLAAQLAIRRGARVLGTAREAHFGFLQSIGVEPVAAGRDAAAQLRLLAPAGIDAALDTVGRDGVATAVDAGVDRSRIGSITNPPVEWGVTALGAGRRTAAELSVVAGLVAKGVVRFPVCESFPLQMVREAYRAFESPHPPGRFVLTL